MKLGALACAATLALALALLGCGGGSGSTPTIAPAPAPAGQAQTRPRNLAAEKRAAGRAAPFVVAGADNSVPTYGSEAGAAERHGAEVNLAAYLHARAASEWGRACDYLAASTRRSTAKLAKGGPDCAKVLAVFYPTAADRADPLRGPLLSLRTQGRSGFAFFSGPGGQQYIVPMAMEGARWLSTQTSPISYPPGLSSAEP